MLKKSIGVGLLCLTGQAYANITVTITDDIVKDDNECSIREAVEYVNTYLTAPTGETDEQKTAREKIKNSGYYGCGGESATANIILKENETYLIDHTKNNNQEIQIKAALTLQTESNEFSTDTSKMGINNATIKASGTHRLFTIYDGNADISQINVKFSQVNLQGCGLTAVCADQGGIIFNREAITLEYVKLFNGYAHQGGAVFSEGVIAGSNDASASVVTMNSSILQNNQATDNGAVLYIGQPLFNIKNSVIRDNKILSNNQGMIFYSANQFNDETTGTTSFTRVAYIVNSTLFKNTGYLLNLRDGVSVNNVTAVDNSRGFYFDAPNEKAHIANSIVVNQQENCIYPSGDKIFTYNNLMGDDSCGSGQTGNLNTILSKQTDEYFKQLFASKDKKSIADDGTELSCERPSTTAAGAGLLCPFRTPKDTFLGYFKPRLLSKYSTLNDSPIVNKGRMYSDGKNQGLYSCESTDQRGLSRSEAVHCDIGAIELIISSDTISRVGADIQYGQIAEISITDSLADGELLPASECEAVLGLAKNYDLETWGVGCLRIEQSSVTPQSKGRMILDESGQLTYTPNSNWHGLDEFNLRIMTTVSRFSDSENNRDIVIPVRIVQSPVNDFKNDKVKVSGGALGGLSLLGLMVLAFRRNRKA